MDKKVAICAIGTEITRGIIQDKHVYYISKELTEIGFTISQATIIPDDDNIEFVLRNLLSNNDVLIITGGLGPTCDDMTRYAISNISNLDLEVNKKAYDLLKEYIKIEVDEVNLRQAMIPKGYKILENKNGTACGFYNKIDNKIIISLPGPPNELRPIFDDDVINILKKEISYKDNSRDEYSTYIIRESKLEETCRDLNIDNVTWATRVKDNHIILYVKGSNKDLFIEKLTNKLTKYLIVKGNIEPIKHLEKVLLDKNLTIGVIEKTTLGYITNLIVKTNTYNKWYKGSVINTVLDIDCDILVKTYKEKNNYFISINDIKIKVNIDEIGNFDLEKKIAISTILLLSFYAQGCDVIDIINNSPYYYV